MPHSVVPVDEDLTKIKSEEYRPSPFIVQAARTGNLQIFKRILNEGPNIKETGFIGFNKKKAQILSNALGCAVFFNNFDIATFILQELGLDNEQDVGVNEEYKEMIDNFDRNKEIILANQEYTKMTPLLLTVKQGDKYEDVVKLMILSKADINVIDCQGNTILHYIAMSSATNIYKLLKAKTDFKPDFEI